MKSAIFGMGCFWCSEAIFTRVDGVLKTTPGYAAGHTDHPSYKQVCSGTTGYAEVIKVDYDESKVSYPTLLEYFFAGHNPTTLNRQGHDVGTQYRSLIVAMDDEQYQLATEAIKRLSEMGIYDQPIVTELIHQVPFFPAEEEHFDYFALHGNAPYCQMVIAPKINKIFGKK